MRYFFVLGCILFPFIVFAQCDYKLSQVYSSRVANYTIKVELDTEHKCLEAVTKLTWHNQSPEPVNELRFYMYQNAFKNTESTFMYSAEGDFFGDNLSSRKPEHWGWIHIDSAVADSVELMEGARYVHPDDDNLKDETVLEIPLQDPLLPGDSLILDLQWSEKIPKIFARSGYERENFYNMVHWFPQVGVWEQDRSGEWGWNCHQFHRRTEFYADFGNYDVEITLPEELVVGASGCRIDDVNHGDGTKTVRYKAEDVIDFAWCAYPHFEVVEDQYEHVFIRLLTPPEHYHLRHRIIKTVKHSLAYLQENVGPYPYSSITILDPPLLGLKAGFMEYPTYITGGSFAVFPRGIRTMESLIAHEFAHQYFMAIIANNEKEEPWMDEGFVTYHEDKIMESLYGENQSLFNILGYKVSNSSFSRHEYVSLENPSCGAIARSGWEINEGFKGITYSKTATMFRTMERMMGYQSFVAMMKSYYEKWSFKHPRGEDFIAHVKEFLATTQDSMILGDPDRFFDQVVYGTGILYKTLDGITYFYNFTGRGIYDQTDGSKDYDEGMLDSLVYSKVILHRKGGVILPVDVRFTFKNGDVINKRWSGEETSKTVVLKNESPLVTFEIDPDEKLYLDINLNNNSYTTQVRRTPALKISSKVMYWVSHIIQTAGILI